MSLRPDCDYVDGNLNERNLGEFDHAMLQLQIAAWFLERAQAWGIRVVPEQRVQVSSSRFRVPDVCVIRRELPIEQIICHPPLICIEVLSKDDTLHDMRERADDYLRMGVQNVWIVDPASRRGYVCTETGMTDPAAGQLTAPGTPICISLVELFERLDDA